MDGEDYSGSAFFFPWVGQAYETGGIFGKKILILGESHYCSEPGTCKDCGPGHKNKCNLFTINAILNQFTPGAKKHAVFTKLARFFLDKESVDNKEKAIFWHSVAFYNYVQTTVSSGAGVPPTEEMFSISVNPFYELMEKLEPDFLLVVSDRLWNNLPGQAGVDWPAGPVITENGKSEKTWYFKGKRKKTLSLVIYHPSTKEFSYDYIPVLKKALEYV
jgi:hypothetical protein